MKLAQIYRCTYTCIMIRNINNNYHYTYKHYCTRNYLKKCVYIIIPILRCMGGELLITTVVLLYNYTAGRNALFEEKEQ